MSYTHLHLTVEDHVGHIQMDYPSTLNALDETMAEELLAAFSDCEENPDVRVILLSGAGRAFCGGGDIRFMMQEVQKPGFSLRQLMKLLSDLTIRMKRSEKVVIAAVRGAAAGGGCNLALAADMIVAADNAKFLQAFVNIGLSPDTGGAFWLPRLVGTARAFEMFATGRPVKADEALALGMVNCVVPEEELKSAAMALAARFAAGPGIAYAGIKKLMWQSMYQDAEPFMKVESDVQAVSDATDDFVEGITAFLEKRKPVFQGK